MEKHSSIVGVVQGILPEEGNTLFAKYYVTVAGNNYLEERFSDYTVRVSAPSFFQVNTLQAEALYSAAIESAELQPEDVVLDAYSGIGLITMMMAKKVRKVMGIEVAPSSIRDAKHNAAAHQITNIDCFEGLTERWISRIPPYDKVLLNPPRGGCEIATLDAITKSRAKRIIYISCDPATLARDAAHLKAAGWHLHKVLPFDMFPQTMHVESIATFSR
jgi:23S rRNA (uracil1939-C5)-methyltransferase